jgi:hypothetical protein
MKPRAGWANDGTVENIADLLKKVVVKFGGKTWTRVLER